MDSLFSILFIAIQERLKTVTLSPVEGQDPKQAFPFIDAEYGQLETHNGDNRPPVSWPCALIDIDNTSFTEIGNNAQMGTAGVTLRLGFPPYSSSSSITPAEYRNKALYHYELEHLAFKALHGWSPGIVQISPTEQVDMSDIFGHLIRTGAQTEERGDLIRVRALTFSLGVEDFSASPTVIIVSPVTINLNPQFGLNLQE